MSKVLAVVTIPSVTAAQYEQLRTIVNWEGNPPAGLVSHVAAFDDAGATIADVWESPQDFQSFADTRLGAGFGQLGITAKPQVSIVPFHAQFPK